MRLDLNQQMRLEQRMKMAPRMIQSMEILQLPLLALQERIEQERLENPVLEVADEGAPDETPPEERLAEEPRPAETTDEPSPVDDILRDWEEQHAETHRPSRGAVEDDIQRKQDAEQNLADKPPGLHEALLEQLRYVDCEPAVYQMAEEIIANIDDNGYLTADLTQLVDPGAGAAGLAVAEEALRVVQRLEPRGVGARSLSECLILQIPAEHPLRTAMEAICRHHLHDVQQNRLLAIQKKTGLSLETIKAAIEAIRHLNPRPGSAFASETAPPITPDLILEETEHGYELRVDEKATPPLRISRQYQELLKNRHLDPKTREFVQRKIQAARWLIEAIEQRRQTLSRVARAIMDHQRAFLEKGPGHIEPLKMQQIADRVGVHVTTVSRAVDGKYIQTPRGIFPLKHFFGGGTASDRGEVVAWETIKQQLVDLIEHEDKANPYSDEQLVEAFARRGLHIARRTITKYRKILNIPSARQRRQF